MWKIAAIILGQVGAHLTVIFFESADCPPCSLHISTIIFSSQLQFRSLYEFRIPPCHGSLSLTDNLHLNANRTNVKFGGLNKLFICIR